MKYRFAFLITIIGVLFIACNSKKKENIPPDEVTKMKQEIEQRKDFISESSILFPDTTEAWLKNISIKEKNLNVNVCNSVFNFYKKNNFSSRWLYKEGASKLFESYLDVIKDSKSYGFNPETYGYTELKKSVEKLYAKEPTIEKISELDKQITTSFMLFAQHLSNGRIINPAAEKHIWKTYDENVDKVTMLLKITDTENLISAIEILHPNNEYYKKLRKRLSELNNNDEKGDYHQFKIDLSKFKLGYENEKIKLLRENLEKRGYSFAQDSIRDKVDEELLEIIKQFQEDKNLKVDGRPGRNTLRYLNLTNEEMKKLLILNMERLRWLNKDFGEEYLIVNIPQYKLFAMNHGKVDLAMRVIVGREYNPTPIFIDSIAYIEFRPTWTVPQSIIKKEMIPRMANDPTRYTRKGFTITENGHTINPSTIDWSDQSVYKRYFTFVEQPSKSNALGLVKFIFPNNMNIYLHDTPTDYLFAREDRAMSHGCIRLSEPAKLATYLLRKNKNWDSEKVKNAMQSGKAKNRVFLKEKVLVQLLYLTAIVINDKVVISNDIYGLDKHQLEILNKDYGI